MPYKSLVELPASVRDNLPKHAQEIYKEAYNSAWDQYADPSSPPRLAATMLPVKKNRLSIRA
jgi:cation transport regulator ChaB